MATIGSIGGRTFRFDGPRGVHSTGGGSPQQSSGGFKALSTRDALLSTESKTKDYLTLVGNINSWGKSMWENAGIDVTKVDPTNEVSIRANQAYLKALALAETMGQDLQNQQKDWERYMSQRFTSQGGNLININRGGNEFVAEDVANTALSSDVKAFNQEGSTFFDEKARDIKLAEYKVLYSKYKEIRDNARTDAEYMWAQANMDGLERPKFDRNKILDRNSRKVKEELPEKGWSQIYNNSVKSPVNGRKFELFLASPNIEDAEEVDTESRTGIKVKYKGEDNYRFINFRDKMGKVHFMNALNHSKVIPDYTATLENFSNPQQNFKGLLLDGNVTPEQGTDIEGVYKNAAINVLSGNVENNAKNSNGANVYTEKQFKDNIESLRIGVIDKLREKMRSESGLIMPRASFKDVPSVLTKRGSQGVNVTSIELVPEKKYKMSIFDSPAKIKIKYSIEDDEGNIGSEEEKFDLSKEEDLTRLNALIDSNDISMSNVYDGNDGDFFRTIVDSEYRAIQDGFGGPVSNDQSEVEEIMSRYGVEFSN